MNTQSKNFESNGIKAFACGVAALALTAVLSWTFVKSSSVAHVGGGLPSSIVAASGLPARLG